MQSQPFVRSVMSHFLTSLDPPSHGGVHALPKKPVPTRPNRTPSFSESDISDHDSDGVIQPSPDGDCRAGVEAGLPATDGGSRPLYNLTELPAPPRPPSPTPPPQSPSSPTSSTSGSGSKVRAKKRSKLSSSSPTRVVSAANSEVLSGKVVKGKSRKGKKEADPTQANTLFKYFSNIRTKGMTDQGQRVGWAAGAGGERNQGATSVQDSSLRPGGNSAT